MENKSLKIPDTGLVSLPETPSIQTDNLGEIRERINEIKDKIKLRENDLVLFRETVKENAENIDEETASSMADYVSQTKTEIAELTKTLIREQEKARLTLQDEILPDKDLMQHGMKNANASAIIEQMETQVQEGSGRKLAYHRRGKEEILNIWLERIEHKSIDMSRIFTISQLFVAFGETPEKAKRISSAERLVVQTIIGFSHKKGA